MSCRDDAGADAAPPPGFCAAPWVDAVIRIDGSILPCCHNDYRYGSIKEASLEAAWHSPPAQDFRARIARGEYPNSECAQCHRDGKHTTLANAFDSLLAQHWTAYVEACAKHNGRGPDLKLCKLIMRFNGYLRSDARTLRARIACRHLIARIGRVIDASDSPAARRSLAKLRTIVRACLDFLSGTNVPAVVATRRQVNLVAVCNARCVHCIGLYTGEIERGAEIEGRRMKRMPAPLAERALARSDDMTSFYMNGSEFLLHPQWEALARTLADSGVRLSMSTNGMLLEPSVADALLGTGVLLDINFSFDGAAPATVERIRAKVSFERLAANARYFLQKVAASGNTRSVCMSMVLMQSNIDECADLVRLARSLRPAGAANLHVVFELLNGAPNPAYNAFYAREWIDISSPVARARLAEAAEVAKEAGIRVFYSGRELTAEG